MKCSNFSVDVVSGGGGRQWRRAWGGGAHGGRAWLLAARPVVRRPGPDEPAMEARRLSIY